MSARERYERICSDLEGVLRAERCEHYGMVTVPKDAGALVPRDAVRFCPACGAYFRSSREPGWASTLQQPDTTGR
jgi:hypothetical protein